MKSSPGEWFSGGGFCYLSNYVVNELDNDARKKQAIASKIKRLKMQLMIWYSIFMGKIMHIGFARMNL